MISSAQRRISLDYLDLGVEAGAERVTGGAVPDGDGWYLTPAVLAGVDNSMRVAQEEIFGPVTSIIPFTDEADAVRIANDTPYGLSGYVQSGDLFLNPIFREMPPLLIEHTEREPVTSLLASTVRQLLAEVETLRPGSREMLGRMMEMLFVEMLRRYVGRLPQGTTGWFGALADPMISRTLQAIHAAPTHDWTVEELAGLAGASRSVLADRFKSILGQPPMQYIASWRLQLATSMLRNGDRALAEIAADVGYESEAAFSRAFKRHLGLPPGAWRQQNLAS